MDVNNIQFTKIEIQIVKHIFKHYKDSYNARQLAKTLNLNHAHINKLCNILADKGLLTKEAIGNAVYFSFNYENKLAIKFMEYILNLEEFPKRLAVLLHSLKKLKPHIELGLVFGSSIKDKKFNDIDVMIMYRNDKKKDVNKAKEEIRKSQLVEQPIRYVDVSEKDAILNKEDGVFYNIISNSLIFHNPEKYVEVIQKCRK